MKKQRAACKVGQIEYLASMRFLKTAGLALFLLSVLAGHGLTRQYGIEPIEREHFVFYFEDPRYTELADSVLTQTRLRLKEFLRDTLNYKPSVYIVGDLKHFQKLIRGLFPDWGAAAAFPQRRLIAIKSPDKFNINKPLHELLAHEYTHLVVAQRTGYNSAPRWFDEGLAMYVSMEWSWSDNLAMSRAAVFGDFLSLKGIEQINRFGEGKAHVAYAESYLAVKYFLDYYGTESANIFLDMIAGGASLDRAMMSSTGSNHKEFEKEFHAYLNEHYNLATLFMDTMFFWLGLAIIVVIGVFLRYRKRRQYYKKWEEDEKLHSTDFDYGDPERPEQTDDDESWRN